MAARVPSASLEARDRDGRCRRGLQQDADVDDAVLCAADDGVATQDQDRGAADDGLHGRNRLDGRLFHPDTAIRRRLVERQVIGRAVTESGCERDDGQPVSPRVDDGFRCGQCSVDGCGRTAQWLCGSGSGHVLTIGGRCDSSSVAMRGTAENRSSSATNLPIGNAFQDSRAVTSRFHAPTMEAIGYRQFINRDLPIQDRGCTSKALYLSRREASNFVRRRGFSGLRPYRCWFCSGWHLGHAKRAH